ncbi:MAG: hypothetical protein HY867_00380 [Chloroflexi bacterium]|nr:hypothetical protein [Chloroflexota bacterium]
MKSSNILQVPVYLFVVFHLLASPTPAKACSCVVPGSPEEELARTDAVFSGKVIGVHSKNYFIIAFIDTFLISADQEPLVFRSDTFWGYRIIFEVIKSWKGVDTTKVTVDTGTGGGDCGYQFIENDEYVVYANHAYGDPKNDWATSICTRTSPVKEAREDLAYFNSLPVLTLRKVPFIFVFNFDLGLALIALGIILAILFARKTRERK